jgi:hypothetical protein
VAGPAATLPSVRNLDPWQGQTSSPSETLEILHPRCVHRAAKTFTSPSPRHTMTSSTNAIGSRLSPGIVTWRTWRHARDWRETIHVNAARAGAASAQKALRTTDRRDIRLREFPALLLTGGDHTSEDNHSGSDYPAAGGRLARRPPE